MATFFDLCEKGDILAAEKYLAKHPDVVNDVNENGLTPVMIAVQTKNQNLLRRLVAKKADVNAKATAEGSSKGYTAVHFAAKEGETAALEMLHEAGAYLKYQGADGWSPLHCASFAGKEEAVKWLLAKKADPNVANEHNITPITFAANHGRLEMVRTLIKAGARLDIKDSNGDSLFHHAMHTQMYKIFEKEYKLPESQVDIACYLALRGADPEEENREGIKPVSYVSAAFGSESLSRLLKLLYMNHEKISKAEGTGPGQIAHGWNFRTILAIKNRQVWDNIGIDPQQGKDIIDAVHMVDKDITARREREKNPKPRVKKPIQKTEQATPKEVSPPAATSSTTATSASTPQPDEARVPPAPPQQEETTPARSPVKSTAEPPQVPTAPISPPPKTTSAEGGKEAVEVLQAIHRLLAEATDPQPPELNWKWFYANRVAVLCCLVAFLLGMMCERLVGR